MWRLHRDRRNRSARGGGRQYRSEQRRSRCGENNFANEPRGGRRNCPPAALAKYRRTHHCRLYRYEEPQGPTGGFYLDEGAAETRQGENPRPSDFPAWFDGNDTATRARKVKRYDLRELSLLRWPK